MFHAGLCSRPCGACKGSPSRGGLVCLPPAGSSARDNPWPGSLGCEARNTTPLTLHCRTSRFDCPLQELRWMRSALPKDGMTGMNPQQQSSAGYWGAHDSGLGRAELCRGTKMNKMKSNPIPPNRFACGRCGVTLAARVSQPPALPHVISGSPLRLQRLLRRAAEYMYSQSYLSEPGLHLPHSCTAKLCLAIELSCTSAVLQTVIRSSL